MIHYKKEWTYSGGIWLNGMGQTAWGFLYEPMHTLYPIYREYFDSLSHALKWISIQVHRESCFILCEFWAQDSWRPLYIVSQAQSPAYI